MLRFYSILLLLVVYSDFGYSKLKVTGTGATTPLYSCRELGGSCLPEGTAKSFAGGTTARCFGQRECDDGFSCCVHSGYEAQNPGKKRKRKKRQIDPDRAVRCPSKDEDPRCGTPDADNPEGGRCRKSCKEQNKNDLPELEKPDNGVCPEGNGCKCCFRQRECKKLKACTNIGGECRGACLAEETELKSITGKNGCKNGCTCCVPNDFEPPPDLPDCKANGHRCTTKKKPECDPDRSETLADDKYSCKQKNSKFTQRCCERDKSVIENSCEAEGQKCKKLKTIKKCDGSIGQRDMTEQFPCPKAKGGNKKICCLKDCYHYRTNQWFAHGERHKFECEWAICKNGHYTTYGQERDKDCCEDAAMKEYYEHNEYICKEHANHTHYSLTCKNGTWINDTIPKESCKDDDDKVDTDISEENTGGEVEVDTRKQKPDSSDWGNDKAEEKSNEANKGTPPKGMKGKGTWGNRKLGPGKPGIGKGGNGGGKPGIGKGGIGGGKSGIGKGGIGGGKPGIGKGGVGGKTIAKKGMQPKGIGANKGTGQRTMMKPKTGGNAKIVKKGSGPAMQNKGSGPAMQNRGIGPGMKKKVFKPGGKKNFM